MDYNTVFNKLTENSSEVIDGVARILERVADNILNNPSDLKYRTLLKENKTVKNKILSPKGGVECLKLMGFQEMSSSFVLPANIATNKILEFKEAFRTWINSRSNKTSPKIQDNGPDSTKKALQNTSNEDVIEKGKLPSLVHDNGPDSTKKALQNTSNEDVIEKVKLPPLVHTYSIPFLRSLEVHSHLVQQYENKRLQERSKKLIPLKELELEAQSKLRFIQENVKKNKLEDPEISIQDTLLLALLKWFKTFFDWVDSPDCENCGGEDTSFSHMSTDSDLLHYTDRVEMHKCKICNSFTPFPRYNDLNILLETRRGRCGEWANTFTLFCRAMGWDARFVVCEGDHVWTEVYSVTQKRWLHCDPCENICDTPLIYENGWNKQISYVIAYSAEEIQDVTWRYSSKHKEVLKRRNNCTESELMEAILDMRTRLIKNQSQTRKQYLIKRTLMELVEFLTERKPTDCDKIGRTSGASAWRLARNEMSEISEERKFIWLVNSSDIDKNSITIRYSASQNRYEYISGDKKLREMCNWYEGAYEHNNLFRKEERDWKMVYLARNEGEEFGRISWKIDLTNVTRKLKTISVNFKFQTFENGITTVTLRSNIRDLSLPIGSEPVTTQSFANAKELILEALLFGGKGDVAWQHSQLFRQSLEDIVEYPFSITLTFN